MKVFVVAIILYIAFRGILAIAGFYSIGILNAGLLGVFTSLIAGWLVKPATE